MQTVAGRRRRPSASIPRSRPRSDAYSDEDIFARLSRIREGASVGRRTLAEAVRVRRVRKRPAGDRAKPSDARSSMHRRCRARPGPTRAPVSIFPRSRISSRCIACARCPASTASRGSRQHRRPRTASSRTCSSRCAARRFRRTRIGCPQSSNSARAFSSTSTKRRSRNGCTEKRTRQRHDKLFGGLRPLEQAVRRARRRAIPARRTFCCTASRMR